MAARTRRKSVDRRSLSRTTSRQDEQRSMMDDQQSLGPDDEEALLSDDDGVSATSSRRRHRKPPSPQRGGVFGGLANLFSRHEAGSPTPRRRSHSQSSISRFSRRSRRSVAASEAGLASDDEEERWGYSSGEEDSEDEDMAADAASLAPSMQYDSDRQSIDEGNGHLPMLDFDPVFGGESRIDMEMSFTLTEPPPEGPPSRQTIYIPDEDSTIRFVGYEAVRWREWCWNLACVFTLGFLALFGHWFPRLWLRWVAREKAFIDAKRGFVVVEVSVDIANDFCYLMFFLQVSIQSYHDTAHQTS